MNIEYMREFLTLAETLNYRAAADTLFISQPTLTRHVNAIEEQLGSRLLERTKHSVELTEAGKLAETAFKNAVQTYDTLRRDIDALMQEEESDLRLGMLYYGTTAFYGYPLLEALSARYPHVRVSTLTAQSAQIYRYLHRGVIDVGLTISSDSYGSDIERFKVATIPLYAFVLSDHPLATRNSVSVEELAMTKLILNTIPVAHEHHVLRLFENHGLHPKDIVYADHIDTLLPTMAKTGSAFVGSMLLSGMPQQPDIFIPIEADDFTIDVSLVYLRDNVNPNIPKLIEAASSIRKPPM